jgi:hypothetical protein
MKLNKFQMLEFSSWKGVTKETHLGKLFRSEPQKATTLMIQLLAAHRGKTLETYLSKLPVKTFETDDEYTWEVIGSSRRNIPLVEARTNDGTVVTSAIPMVGANQEPFYLVFSEDWFGDGEVIVGEKNEVYPLIILGQPRMEGTNAVYKVELMGGNTVGMPFEELLLGKRFSWEYAPVERSFSRGVGTVRYTSPIAMRNEWSQIRIRSEIGGSMLNKKLAVGIPVTDNGGKKLVHNMWMHHEDWKVEETFSEYKNNLLMYGRSNRNANGEYLNIGKSGEVIKMGAGVREQMEYGNTMFYNTFSLKLIEDALHELSSGKLGFGERRFILRTGERGATEFSKAVLNTVSGWTAFNYFGGNGNINTVNKTSSELHSNALSAGFQFTEYKAPNGAIISIEVDSMYDDQVRNKIMHPKGGVAMSYRYDIMYIGTMEVPNIQLAKLANNDEYKSYQWGIRNPYTGQTNNPYMSFDEDKAVIHKMAILGAFIIDPSRTMSLIPNLLA